MQSRAVWLSALALALALAAAGSACAADQPAREITETKDRVTFEEMEVMVAGPLALAKAGDMAAAQAALDRLLDERRQRYGADSVEVADTLNAFVVAVFNDVDRRSAKAAALELAPRLLDAVRRAWGSDHIEYALLLNDLVQMDHQLNGDAVGPQSEAALMEVYRIRADRLGPRHKETIATLIWLGEIQGLRSRTHGEIARAAPAIATLRRAIAEEETDREPANNDNLWARSVLADTFARNGALEPAMQTFERMREMARAQDADTSFFTARLANALKEGGFAKESDEMSKLYLQQSGLAGLLPALPGAPRE